MNGFLKRASAFVTAVFMMFGILTVFPEEWFSQISLLVSAEESNLYIIKTEQVCNNAQFTINSITMCAASEGLCKMNVTITKSEDVEWNDSEGLYIFIYGKKTNEENYVKIGGIASTSFGSSTLSFMVDGPDETSPLETYSEIYFDCGYGYGNSTTELKNSFVSCTRIYMSTSAPQEDEEITYKIYNGHNYTVFNNKATTWLEAEAYCESLGGHLATISDANENEAVYSIMRELGFESAYFGYSDHISQGTWKWVTDENITYTNWASGEPNNYPSLEYYGSREPYAMFYSKYTDAKWNSGDFGVYTDNGGKAFICEWDSGSSTEETDPIEIDVQLLDKDNNPIDTIEYKRGEINAYLKVSFSNKPISIINIKSNVLIMKDADNNESKLVCYDVGSNQNEIIIPIVGFSMYCDNEDHSSNIYCGQNITVNVECIYGEGEEDKACKNFSFPCKSDVFNVVNGEYDTDEVDYELLTNYFWQDTLLFKYIYYGKDLYLPGIKYNIKRSCSNGTCFGFSSVLSVLRNSNSVKKYFNLNNISDINAQTSYGELQFKQLIQIMQTSQFSVAIRKELNDKEHFNNLPNLVEAVKKIQPNDMEKMLIWVQSDNSAHLLTPYKINDMGELFEGQYEILERV